jgi:hypothetical protein
MGAFGKFVSANRGHRADACISLRIAWRDSTELPLHAIQDRAQSNHALLEPFDMELDVTANGLGNARVGARVSIDPATRPPGRLRRSQRRRV